MTAPRTTSIQCPAPTSQRARTAHARLRALQSRMGTHRVLSTRASARYEVWVRLQRRPDARRRVPGAGTLGKQALYLVLERGAAHDPGSALQTGRRVCRAEGRARAVQPMPSGYRGSRRRSEAATQRRGSAEKATGCRCCIHARARQGSATRTCIRSAHDSRQQRDSASVSGQMLCTSGARVWAGAMPRCADSLASQAGSDGPSELWGAGGTFQPFGTAVDMLLSEQPCRHDRVVWWGRGRDLQGIALPGRSVERRVLGGRARVWLEVSGADAMRGCRAAGPPLWNAPRSLGEPGETEVDAMLSAATRPGRQTVWRVRQRGVDTRARESAWRARVDRDAFGGSSRLVRAARRATATGSASAR